MGMLFPVGGVWGGGQHRPPSVCPWKTGDCYICEGRAKMERRETDGPSKWDSGEYLMEALRQAEELGWHHCPSGTLEGDHYDRLVEMLRLWYLK